MSPFEADKIKLCGSKAFDDSLTNLIAKIDFLDLRSRNRAVHQEIVDLFKDFKDEHAKFVKNCENLMNKNDFDEKWYMILLNGLHQKHIDKIHSTLVTWHNLTTENISQLHEIMQNIMKLNKKAYLFLKNKQKEKVNAIIS